MLQQDTPDDYVLATGKSYSVREFIEKCFYYVGLNLKWEGKGLQEVGKVYNKIVIRIKEKYYRPNEVDFLLGDASKARDLCRQTAKVYHKLPNYRNNWLRMGLSEEDIDSLSNKFIDTTFAWGNTKDIETRLKEHFDAGANHVCIQPLNPNGKVGEVHWECLEALIS